MSALRLVVVQGQAVGTQLRLENRQVAEVGRSAAADLTLNDPDVSDIHLKLYPEGETYSCFDVTGAGFLHNGRRSLRAQLRVGDVIQVGGHQIRLLSDAAVPDRMEVPSQAPTGAAFVALQGNDAGKSFPLQGKTVWILGRGVSTDITIWDIRASRAHCRIDRGPEGYAISDLNSSNGTLVNGGKITTHPLVEGDLIKIGATVLRFVANGSVG